MEGEKWLQQVVLRLVHRHNGAHRPPPCGIIFKFLFILGMLERNLKKEKRKKEQLLSGVRVHTCDPSSPEVEAGGWITQEFQAI